MAHTSRSSAVPLQPAKAIETNFVTTNRHDFSVAGFEAEQDVNKPAGRPTPSVIDIIAKLTRQRIPRDFNILVRNWWIFWSLRLKEKRDFMDIIWTFSFLHQNNVNVLAFRRGKISRSPM